MKRPLRPDERDLWDRVARSVRPLHERIAPAPAPQAEPVRPKATGAPAMLPPKTAAKTPRLPVKPLSPAPIDARTARRIRKGSTTIDARLDLHGMTRDAAYERLLSFLAMSRAFGHRTVLVITGKGFSGAGVLRREVPLWLGNPEFRVHVSAIETAGRRHGGEGALDLRLRRAP